MPDTRYRRGRAYAADMAVYARSMASDNSAQLDRVKRNLVRALREDVTARQREFLLLYYGQGLNMREIGEKLGVDKSTVSRTIKRGEARLRRCLRYGAKAFLEEESGFAPGPDRPDRGLFRAVLRFEPHFLPIRVPPGGPVSVVF